MYAPADEEAVGSDEESIGRLAPNCCESRLDFAAGACVEDLNLQSDGASRFGQVAQRGLCGRSIRRIDQHSDTNGFGRKLMKKSQPFRNNFTDEGIHAGSVAARMGETGNKAELDWVLADAEHDGDRRSRRFGCERCGRTDRRGYDGNRAADEISDERGEAIVAAIEPMVLDRYILPLDIAAFRKPFAKRSALARGVLRRATVDETDDRHRRLLCPRRGRPRCRRAAEKRDELTPIHSITSSARASTVAGTSRPSALAVLRLITSSYLVGACTGRSDGFSPLRMRST